jgi:hypothetical protein
MGLATLNVWVHDKQDPCKISNDVWLITVTYCNGNPVEWCGRTYWIEEAKCGHVDIQLPPGCYIVYGFQFIPFKPFPLLNLTEHAIVVVACDQLACVHLYTPTDRQRSIGNAMAVKFLAETQKLSREKVAAFVAASDALLKEMPETARDSAFDRLLEQLADPLQKRSK